MFSPSRFRLLMVILATLLITACSRQSIYETAIQLERSSSGLEADRVQEAIAAGETALGSGGRLLIRKSGTEPLIRVMGEAEDLPLLDRVLTSITDAVRAES